MGSSESKKADEEEEEDHVNEPYLIQWDEHGHLRYGQAHKIDPGKQMVEIMELDFVDDIDGKTWYIIETAWLTAWLAYVHHDKYIAPAPGPCRNNHLIQWDAVQNKYVGRSGLRMASKNVAGDFRRISRETWQKFKEFYPESGPSITMEFNAIMNNGEDANIGRHFTILDPPPAPVVTASKSLKKKAIMAAKKAEAEQAALEAAARLHAELAKTPPASLNLAADEFKDGDTRSERGFSTSSSFSAAPGVRNDPRVVSNLPNQPYNPVAEQYARRAVSQAGENSYRASERASLSQHASTRDGREGSFSGGMPVPVPVSPPPSSYARPRSGSFSKTLPPPAAPGAQAPTQATRLGATSSKPAGAGVQDMYYTKD